MKLCRSVGKLQHVVACCWRADIASWPPTGLTRGSGRGSAALFGAPVAYEPHDCERVGVPVREGHPDVDGDDSYDGDGCNAADHCQGRVRRARLPAPHTCATCARHRASRTRLEQADLCKSRLCTRTLQLRQVTQHRRICRRALTRRTPQQPPRAWRECRSSTSRLWSCGAACALQPHDTLRPACARPPVQQLAQSTLFLVKFVPISVQNPHKQDWITK